MEWRGGSRSAPYIMHASAAAAAEPVALYLAALVELAGVHYCNKLRHVPPSGEYLCVG